MAVQLPTVTVTAGGDAGAFYAAAAPFLRDGGEFRFLAIAAAVCDPPQPAAAAEAAARFAEAAFFVARQGEAVVMVAMREAPATEVIVSRDGTTGNTDDVKSGGAGGGGGGGGGGAVAVVMADAIQRFCAASPPASMLAVTTHNNAVGGSSGSSEAVAHHLAQIIGTGSPPLAGRRERYLLATAAREPPRGMPEGCMRQAIIDAAVSDDSAVLTAFADAFQADVGVDLNKRRPGAEIIARLKGSLFVWCVPEGGQDRVVAMAAVLGPAEPVGMQRISLVYTPPGSRRRGFAGALVSAVAAALLAQGQPYVGICTDAANLTSNRVYESVGFECISAVVHFSFDLGSSREDSVSART
jgi:GNAT superfamily N-acetyltransferase